MDRSSVIFHPSRNQQRALRIAVVSETYAPEINGVAITTERVVEALYRRGHHIQLVRPRQNSDRDPKGSDIEIVLVRGVALPGYRGLQIGFPAPRLLRKLWRDRRPDIVHLVTEGPLGWSALSTARELGIPVSSDYHTHFHHYSGHYGFGFLGAAIAAYMRRFHNKTRCTFVPTAQLAGELESTGLRNLQVIRRGVDGELFNPERRSAELRRTWGAGMHTPVVMYVGRIAPEKNLHLVIRAFGRVQTIRPDARLVWVGDGSAFLQLQAQHPQHVFAGMRRSEDLATHYASGDVFLFPSLTETYGNVTV
ncbi:MAG: glycosyltransferase family 4 protein, partial [Burkholderiales bacterium]